MQCGKCWGEIDNVLPRVYSWGGMGWNAGAGILLCQTRSQWEMWGWVGIPGPTRLPAQRADLLSLVRDNLLVSSGAAAPGESTFFVSSGSKIRVD